MTAIATTIAHEDSCPDIVLNNTTNYPSNTSHDVTNFTEYVKLVILLSNGLEVVLGSNTINNIEPPAESLSVSYNTCLTGKFTGTYTAIPTPPDSVVQGQSNSYDRGDNFYFNGNIYKVDAANGITIPANGFTNEALVAIYLATDPPSISIVYESEINSKYTAVLEFTNWCSLYTCLLDKLVKLNCLIVDEPTRNDLCENNLLGEVEQLNFIKYQVNNVLSNPYSSSPKEDYEILCMSNYVNSICCTCKNCDCQ